MPLYPSWQDICLRLVLTIIAGAVVGFNRGARGHAAGLRTTILVCLAASIAMIQANILLSVAGKTNSSFGVMDLMRMPLGILTGVGFIGGGAILRRGDFVTGVTTAATLWVVTVIGLCLGGGQIQLGVEGTVLAFITLWALKWIDTRIPREHWGQVVISSDRNAPLAELPKALAPLGFVAEIHRQTDEGSGGQRQLYFDVCWRRPEVKGPPVDLIDFLNENFKVVTFELTSETRH